MDLLTKIHRKYFAPGSGLEGQPPCSCTYFELALMREEHGDSQEAEELLAAAVEEEEVICGEAWCWFCGSERFLPDTDEVS